MTASVQVKQPAASLNGVNAGPQFKYSQLTDKADPGEGFVRFNNSTLASITEAYFDDLANGGGDVSAWLDSFDSLGATTKGFLFVSKLSDPSSAYIIARCEGAATDETGYWSISSLTVVASAGSFEHGDVLGTFYCWGGDAGPVGGVAELKWATSTSGDPGSGYVGINNATYASATELRASETDLHGSSIAAILARIDDATNSNGKAVVRIQNHPNTDKWIAFNVTSNETDNGGWKNWTFTYLGQGGTAFVADDVVWLSFFPSGNDGAGAVDTVHGRTGNVVSQAGDYTAAEVTNAFDKTADDTDDITEGLAKFVTAAQKTKLDGIETGADVTDATNVSAAGATMNTDTDVSGNSWVLDEDTMSSDSNTQVPTQQSTKAYVDSRIKTGTYTGDGTTSQAITGVGFQPKYLKIVNQTTDAGVAHIIWTTNVIVDDDAQGGAIREVTTVSNFYDNRILSLDSDGFTVSDDGADEHPNKDTTVYNYIAFG